MNNVIEAVGDTGEKAGGWADEPTERAGFVVTSVGRFFVFVCLSLRLVCGCVFACGWILGRIGGFRVGENRGGEDGG